MVTSTITNEDTLVNVGFSIIHQNEDTDETLTSVWIKQSDVEGKDFNLYFGNSTATTLSAAVGSPGVELDGGYYKLTGTAINNIYAKGDANRHGEYSFNTKYEVTDPSSDSTLASVTSQTDGTYTLTVEAVTDDTATSIPGITGDSSITVVGTEVTATKSTSISVNVTVTQSNDPNAGNLPDIDGSEQLIRFVIDGVPDGVTVVDGVYIGDTLGNPNTAQWMLEVNPDVPFNSPITQTLIFNLDGSASELAGLDQPITITALTQDTGSFVQNSSETWTLITTESFDDSGKATDIPAVITTSEFTPVITANEDTPINLNDLVDLQITTGDNSPFSITLTDLPAGTQVTGMIQTNVSGQIIWTASSTGGDTALQNLLSSITVTPPSNWNDNNHPSELTFDTVLTTYAPGGEQNVEHVMVSQPITPVTDATNIAVSAPDVNEGTAVSITIDLSNSADGSYTNIVDGKLYVALNEDNMDTAGSLFYNSVEVESQAISGVSGVPNGTYYVIDSVSNDQTLNVSYQPSAHASGDVTLTALLVSQETDAANTVTSSQPETFTVNPVNSGFDITADDIACNEDCPVQLDLSGTGLVDIDGSESVMAATLAGIPDGYLVYSGANAGSATLASNTGGSLTNNIWSIPLIAGALPAYIAIKPPTNYSGTVEGLILTVLSGEEGLDPIESTSTFDLTVNPLADGLTITPTSTFGVEGDKIALNLNASMIDSDGSETMTLSLTHLGEYASFYAGSALIPAAYDTGTDTYTLSGITVDQIDDLSFIQSARNETVTVTANTVETANGAISASVSSTFSLDISEVLATSGDNTLLYDGARTFDGLGGNDTITMRLGESIDFAIAPEILNIESFDLTGSGTNTLDNLSMQNVIDMTDTNNYLTILGDSDDIVNIYDGSWTNIETTGGFNVYTGSTDPGTVTLRIQEGITVNPLADGLTITPDDSFGFEGEHVALNFNASMLDSDGSETATIALTGLGGSASFFAGATHTPISAVYVAGTDTYTLSGITSTEIDNLYFTLGSPLTGNVDVKAYTVETSNSNISSTVTGSFNVNISALSGTSGPDTFEYDGTSSFDGLDGNDTITMRFDESINFDTNNPVIRNIESIDLRGSGDNSIQHLSVQDVIDVTDSNNYLTIFGDSNDSVNIIDDGNWTQSTQTEGSLVFDVYTNSASPDVTLRIQQEIIDNLS
ncbi:MAG: hypothetical protein RBQ82_05880 [Synergistaceae bacterium]|nr:hypothetical protein [Synergistaceae bacterium]